MHNLFYSATSAVSSLTRDQIDDIYKWNLKDIYEDDNQWEKDFTWVEENLTRYRKYEGKLSSSPEIMLECFKFDDETGIKISRLHLYAMLAKDSDMKVQKYQAMDSRIRALYSKTSAESSFIRPEILSIPDADLIAMLNSNPELMVYKHSIDELLRTKSHILPKEQEEILALSGEVMSVPYNAYSMFTNADMKFESVLDEKGNTVDVSHAKFYAAMYSKDRRFRQDTFRSYYKPYKDFVSTITTLFNGNLKTKMFNAKVRKYNSAREAALDRNNIPVSVYDNLVASVNDNLNPLHRWGELKKKILGLDELHPYDTYVSLINEVSDKKYDYEHGKELVRNSLHSLGSEYLEAIDAAFNNRWIDVYETPSKRSGAYSSGTTFGVHPYVLLNWTDLLNDVFTLAHEMGHNMHSYFTGLNQPFTYANYSIFLAEVASTFNESLLLDYLIEHADSAQKKLYLIEKYISNITSTFYRQVMFAEYEMEVYKKAESGTALTSDMLRNMYRELYQKYWGPAMVIDEEEEFTWTRIPHFYYNFYVFQYATGYAASEVLAYKVKTGGREAVDKYLNFLKAGSSDYSINILKAAGVDMNSPEPVLATTQKFNYLLNEFEKLIGETVNNK
jgi:oligoendopeptidase F